MNNTLDLEHIEKMEQAERILRVFGNDDESPFLLLGAGTAEELFNKLSFESNQPPGTRSAASVI